MFATQAIKTIGSFEFQVFDLICEYVEVYLHCVLYKTKLYKKTLFDKFQKYSIIVYVSISSAHQYPFDIFSLPLGLKRCNNDLICNYIEKCIECLRLLLDDDLNQTVRLICSFCLKDETLSAFNISRLLLQY